MIRVYLACLLLAINGVAFMAMPIPALNTAGLVELIVAAIGLHAHFTQE
jgi:hypothetical protein